MRRIVAALGQTGDGRRRCLFGGSLNFRPLSVPTGPTYDITIVGGGIIGLATARELLYRDKGLRVCVLEKEAEVAMHQSRRNSGVIHAGIYYAPGSKRAEFCVQGARRMYAYCEERGLPFQKIGKLIVAITKAELPGLQRLYERGMANGVRGLRLVEREEILDREPYLRGAIRGILSPETGIADFRAVALSYAAEVRAMGGEILTGWEANTFGLEEDGVVIESRGGRQSPLRTRHIIGCAGLESDRVAGKSGGDRHPGVVPFRGEWLVMKPEFRHTVNQLIYPVPDPSFPWLGIHFTPKMDGNVWIGPNAVLATAREGYRISDVHLGDLRDTLSHPGLPALLRKYWRVGVTEAWRSIHRRLYVKRLQAYIPDVSVDWFESGKASGVRALALQPDGTLVDDFCFADAQSPGWAARALHVRNAPSPAATSSLAIAEAVANIASERFGLCV